MRRVKYISVPAKAYRDSDDIWMTWAEQAGNGQTVIESEPSPTFSGVYDHEGRELHRMESKPIGFIWGDE